MFPFNWYSRNKKIYRKQYYLKGGKKRSIFFFNGNHLVSVLRFTNSKSQPFFFLNIYLDWMSMAASFFQNNIFFVAPVFWVIEMLNYFWLDNIGMWYQEIDCRWILVYHFVERIKDLKVHYFLVQWSWKSSTQI